MSPILFHLGGPFAIRSYGVMIAIGLFITLFLLQKDKKLQRLVTEQQFSNFFHVSFFAALVGGRVWFSVINYQSFDSFWEIFAVWSGGLSVLGAMIASLAASTWYLRIEKIPVLPFLDRVTLYVPLLQSISRLGCFFAGCCYGRVTHVAWAVTYFDPDSLAPLYQPMHPTQIYSSLCLAFIFIILLALNRMKNLKTGQITFLYIALVSLERFFVDFWRGDQEIIDQNSYLKYFSIQQLLAILLFLGAMSMITIITKDKKSE